MVPMDAALHIRKYVEARGGKDSLAEAEKAALAGMAKRGKVPPKPHRPEDAKRTGVDIQPTTEG